MSPARPATLDQWLAHIEQQHPQPSAMGLERVREVAARMGLGRPGKRCIVVGGTNGKGSTVAFIESIARAAGWKVHQIDHTADTAAQMRTALRQAGLLG